MENLFSEKQKEALKFFQENLQNWVNDPLYRLKHVIIYENKAVGVFDTFETALTEAVAKYPRDAFVIQQVVKEEDVVNYLYSAVS